MPAGTSYSLTMPIAQAAENERGTSPALGSRVITGNIHYWGQIGHSTVRTYVRWSGSDE